MAAPKNEQTKRWEQLLAPKKCAGLPSKKISIPNRDARVPYGSYMTIKCAPTDAVIVSAKTILLTQSYLPLKASLRHYVGAELSPIEWIVKKAEPVDCPGSRRMYFPSTVAWKAYADMLIGNNALRRMRLAAKRAEHAKSAIRRSMRRDWEDYD